MEEKELKQQAEKANTTAPAPKKRAVAKTTPVKQEDDLKAKLESAEKENDEMRKMLEALQDQVASIKNQTPQYIIQQQGASDTPCEIGCRLFCGATLTSPSGDVEITIKCGEEVEVTIREVGEIFRSQFGFKKMFEKGVLYFVDPEMYNHFKIRNVIDLSDDALLPHLLDEDYNNMIGYLKNITNDKRDDMISHTICYNTAQMFKDGKLSKWNYDSRINFEHYMGVNISELSKMIDRAKESGLS